MRPVPAMVSSFLSCFPHSPPEESFFNTPHAQEFPSWTLLQETCIKTVVKRPCCLSLSSLFLQAHPLLVANTTLENTQQGGAGSPYTRTLVPRVVYE